MAWRWSYGARAAELDGADVMKMRVWAREEAAAGRVEDGILSLLAHAASRDPRRAESAAGGVTELVEAVPSEALPRVDEEIRRGLMPWNGGEGPALAWLRDPARVRALAVAPEHAGAVLGVAAAHPSGYVREAAVRRLAALRDGAELPWLLVRANDWVEPVRAAAKAAVEARLEPEYAPHFVRHLPLVMRLAGCGRDAHLPLVEGVRTHLREPSARAAVEAGLASPERAVRRLCAEVLLDGVGGMDAALVERLLASRDPMVRLRAVGAAEALDDAALARLLPEAAADPFAGVRRAALRLAPARTPREAVPLLRWALLDRSAGIRAEARWYLDRMAPTDFAAVYRAVAEREDGDLAVALAGLVETGREEDAGLVRRFVAHPCARVRGVALGALARLAGAEAVPALLAALADDNPKVSRVARDALGRFGVHLDASALAALFEGDHPLHVRWNALSLLAGRTVWDVLPTIVRGLADPDEAVAGAAKEWLSLWRGRVDRGAVVPTREQRARIEAALEADTRVDRKAKEWIRFVLRTTNQGRP